MKRLFCIFIPVLLIIGLASALVPTMNSSSTRGTSSVDLTLARPSHASILVDGDSQFITANGVRSGDGTQTKPYLIDNWDVNASSATGITIVNTTAYFIVNNCTIHDGGWYANKNGVEISNVTNGCIENCSITNNNFAMLLKKPTSNITVKYNFLQNNYYGIFVWFARNNTISHTRISNTQGTAIVISDHSNYNNISYNNISINYYNGIWVSSYSSNNTISYNDIISCFKYGVIMEDSYDNRIDHNNFIDNNEATSVRDPAHIQANDTAGLNFWNDSYPSGGNYWSDWTSPDVKKGPNQDQSGTDGIVDDPYILDGGKNVNDSYPFVNLVQDAGTKISEPYPAPLIIISVLLITALVAGRRCQRNL